MSLEPRQPYGSGPGEVGPEPAHVRREAGGYTRESGQVELDRVPPQSVELEMAVLGGVMLEAKAAYPIVVEVLTRESFYLDGHAIIFELMGELHRRGIPPDSAAVLDELRARALLDKVGGSGVIMAMLNAVPTAANVEYHARKVAEKAHRRNLIRACTQVIDEGYRQEVPLEQLIGMAESAVHRVGERAIRSTSQHIGEVADAEWDALCELQEKVEKARQSNIPLPKLGAGFTTGIRDLDAITGGFEPSTNTVIGALPSVGKTALMCHSARALALSGVPVAIVSLEMSAKKISNRILCQGTWTGHSGVSTRMLKLPTEIARMQEWQWRVMAKAYEQLRALPLYIVNADARTPGALRAQVRRLVQQRLVRVVFLDYIQLMSDDADHGSNRASEVAAISRKNTLMAHELDLALVQFSQLNRATHGNSNKRAGLENLRESGMVEADADVVIFPYRRQYHDKGYEPPRPPDAWFADAPAYERGVALHQQGADFWRAESVEFEVAKNRDGETGRCEALMRRALGRFWDVTLKDQGQEGNHRGTETQSQPVGQQTRRGMTIRPVTGDRE